MENRIQSSRGTCFSPNLCRRWYLQVRHVWYRNVDFNVAAAGATAYPVVTD